MTNLLLLTEDPIATAGFKALMQGSNEFSLSVCGKSDDLKRSVLRDYPDILLIDASRITLDSLAEIRSKAPTAGVILWVDSICIEFVSQAIEAGVSGVIRRGTGVESYWNCLRQVARGKIWLEHALSVKLLQVHNVHLSPRERQLVALLALGLPNKELALRLGITSGTVKVYLSRLYNKLGVKDRFELALHSLKNLSPDQTSASDSLQSAHSPFTMPRSLNLANHTTHTQAVRAR